jgi:hypothetical protein
MSPGGICVMTWPDPTGCVGADQCGKGKTCRKLCLPHDFLRTIKSTAIGVSKVNGRAGEGVQGLRSALVETRQPL